MYNRLKKGDTIGVIAPSSPYKEKDLEDIENSKKIIESLGLKVLFSNNMKKNTLGYAVSVEYRVKDIHEMFENKDIKAIFCLSGGFCSNTLFEYLDYELIKNNPKPIIGFSDSTSITNMITEKSKIVTFNGPTFKSLTSWETSYAFDDFVKMLYNAKNIIGNIEDEYISIKKGTAQGILVGGNLSLVSQLSSGTYSVDFKDKILFLEELHFETPPELLYNYLYNLKQNKVFDKIRGIWLGNYGGEEKIEKVLLDVIKDEYCFPIIKSENFGHIDKKALIPVGAMAKINTNNQKMIELTEIVVE